MTDLALYSYVTLVFKDYTSNSEEAIDSISFPLELRQNKLYVAGYVAVQVECENPRDFIENLGDILREGLKFEVKKASKLSSSRSEMFKHVVDNIKDCFFATVDKKGTVGIIHESRIKGINLSKYGGFKNTQDVYNFLAAVSTILLHFYTR